MMSPSRALGRVVLGMQSKLGMAHHQRWATKGVRRISTRCLGSGRGMPPMATISSLLSFRGCRGRNPALVNGTSVQKQGFSQLEGNECPKAAALIIGNEILNGQIADTNLHWLSKMLYNRGLDMVRAEFVPDDEEEIAESLLKLKERVGDGGIIFTSGGIGPTHDDVTYQAVARAFRTETEEHEETIQRMREHYLPQGKEVNESRKRMARLPKGCDAVLYTPGTWVPLAVIQGVHILPGIPRLFQQMLKAQESRFKGPAIFSQTVYTHSGEGDLAAALTQIAQKYSKVDIGSYPNTKAEDDSYVTKLVLHSRDPKIIEEATEDITSLIPKCWQ